MPAFRVKTRELQHIFDPLVRGWDVGSICPSEVREAIDEGKFEKRCWQDVSHALSGEEARRYHIERVAELVISPGEGRRHLVVCFASDPPEVYFYDGNHRFAAACVRGDPDFDVWIATDKPDHLKELFPPLQPLNRRAVDGSSSVSSS